MLRNINYVKGHEIKWTLLKKKFDHTGRHLRTNLHSEN